MRAAPCRVGALSFLAYRCDGLLALRREIVVDQQRLQRRVAVALRRRPRPREAAALQFVGRRARGVVPRRPRRRSRRAASGHQKGLRQARAALPPRPVHVAGRDGGDGAHQRGLRAGDAAGEGAVPVDLT